MKIAVVIAIVVAVVIFRRLYIKWQTGLQRPVATSSRVPRDLLGSSDRTWVVFTTPFCASCGPVKERLASRDPSAEIVTIDATREPHLAGAFEVRSAPTVLLADREGEVQARLVGAAAVRDYFAARTA